MRGGYGGKGKGKGVAKPHMRFGEDQGLAGTQKVHVQLAELGVNRMGSYGGGSFEDSYHGGSGSGGGGGSFSGYTSAHSVPRAPSSAAEHDMVTIDGSGGGGQVLRNTFSYAALSGRAVRITNIRAIRDPPGFRPQHLAGAQLCERLSGGVLHGGRVGSTEATFFPSGRLRGGVIEADTCTAGSCTLLVQTALPLALFAPGEGDSNLLRVWGGTDLGFSPPLDYLLRVFIPVAARFGADIQHQGHHRGLYNRGGGHVFLRVARCERLSAVRLLTRGAPVSGRGRVYATYTSRSGCERAAQQQAASVRRDAERLLAQLLPPGAEVGCEVEVAQAQNAGVGLVVWVQTADGCVLGGSHIRDERDERNKRPLSDVAERACHDLQSQLAAGGCVDEHMQDQIVVLMALADGESEVAVGKEILEHTRCAMATAQQLTAARFAVQGPDRGGVYRIRCKGVGYSAAGRHQGAAVAPPPLELPADSGCQGISWETCPEAAEEELRVDPADGRSYSREQFLQCYGTLDEWNRAGRAAPAAAAAGPSAAPPGAQYRVDPADGRAYTRAEFVSCYGGDTEWRSARPVQVAAASAQPEPEAAPPELRRDPTDGQFYTQSDFVACYGGTAEWDRAAPT